MFSFSVGKNGICVCCFLTSIVYAISLFFFLFFFFKPCELFILNLVNCLCDQLPGFFQGPYGTNSAQHIGFKPIINYNCTTMSVKHGLLRRALKISASTHQRRKKQDILLLWIFKWGRVI